MVADTIPGCRWAADPAHACSAFCKEVLAAATQQQSSKDGPEEARAVSCRWMPIDVAADAGAFPVPRMGQADAEDIRADFLENELPVVVTGAMARWRAMQLWTMEYLARECGDAAAVLCGAGEGQPLLRVKLRDLLEYCRGDKDAATQQPLAHLAKHEPAPGVTLGPAESTPLGEALPFVSGHVSWPAFLAAHPGRRGWAARARLAITAPGAGSCPPAPPSEWAWVAQIIGLAHVRLAPPLTSGGPGPEPFVTLGPGECLLVPPGWAVHATALAPSAAVTCAFAAPLRRGPAGVDAAEPARAPADPADDPDADIYGTPSRGGLNPAVGDLPERAEALKRRGNLLFGAGEHAEATGCYDRAIEVEPHLPHLMDLDMGEEAPKGASVRAACLANRAACWVKLARWTRARDDATEVVRAGGGGGAAGARLVVKALYRRAKALEGLGDVEGAMRDLGYVMEMEPNNVDAKKDLEAYDSILHRICVLGNGTPEMRRRQGAGF